MATYLIYGDNFLVAERLHQVKSKITDETVLDANYHKMSGSDIQIDYLKNVCNALPFMDPVRLVIIDNLIESFNTGNTSVRNRTRSRQSSRGIGQWNDLPDLLSSMPETTHAIFVDNQLTKTNPLLKKLEPISVSHRLETPNREDLSRWIKNQSDQNGCSITPSAIRLLSSLIGNDLWALNNELEKLALYTNGQAIEEENVREIVAQAKESNIFNFVDAIIDKKTSIALNLLQQLRQDGQDSSYILAMINRQLRLIASMKDLLESGTDKRHIGSLLRINSQFVIDKTIQQAHRCSMIEVKHRYGTLLQSDLSIKEGRMDPDLALDILVHDLTLLQN